MVFTGDRRAALGRRACLGGVGLVLLLAPLTWLPNRALDAAGDDPKLQFYLPERYTSDLSIYTWSGTNALSTVNIPHPTYPFSLLVLMLKRAGLGPGLIGTLFYGAILGGGFLFCYLLVRELTAVAGLEAAAGFWGAVTGGLAYSLSPVVLHSEWIARLSSVFGIVVYPGLLYFFVAAVVRGNWRYLIGGALLSAVCSSALSVAAPWFFAFLIGAGACVVLIGMMVRGRGRAIWTYGAVYLVVLAGVNLSWVTVLVDSLVTARNIPMLAGGSIARVTVEEGSQFVRGIAPYMNVLYASLMLPSEEFVALGSVFPHLFSYQAMYLLLPLPAAAACGLLLAREKARASLVCLMGPAVLLAYLITVQVTDLGTGVFSWLVGHIPGFVMFRNFYGKFAIGFALFYGAAIGMAAGITLSRIRVAGGRQVFAVTVIAAVLIGGIPLLRGRMACRSAGGAFHERLCPELGRGQLQAARALAADPDVSRLLIFPMSFAQYMAIRGSNGQYYVAVPYLKVLTGKDEFGGMWSFSNAVYPALPTLVGRLVDGYEFEALDRLLRLMNVKYMYRYTDLAPEHAQMFIFKYGVLPRLEGEMLRYLADHSREEFGEVYLYTAPRWRNRHVLGGARLTVVDEPAWLDALVHTEYLDPERGALIALASEGVG
jgi:hypothetical protein